MGYKHAFASSIFAVAVTATNVTANAEEIYKTDQGHTEVLFGWRHAGVSRQHGEFTKLTGTFTLSADKVEDSSISVTIDTLSLHTGFEALDGVLKGSTWLDVEKFPEMTFQSTSIELTGSDTAKVAGDLTLHGVTRPVVLDTKLTHRGSHPVGQYIDYYKGDWLAFHATTKIDHQAFGVGGYSVGHISIEINTELKRE